MVIIGGLSAVLVLGGAAVALLKTAPEKPEEETTSSASAAKESKLIYDKNPDDVESVELKKQDSSFVIEKYAENSWTVNDIADLPLNYSLLSTAVEKCATLTAKQVVSEDPADLSIYGLDAPQLVAEIHLKNGDNILRIGDEIPSGKEYYFTLNDDKTVYTVASSDVDELFNEENDFIQRVMYAKPTDTDTSDDYDPAKINSVTVEREDIDYPIKVEYDPRQDDDSLVTGNNSTHIMTEPVSLNLNPDRSDDFVNGIFDLRASGIAAVHPDEKKLEELGMTEPAATLDFDVNAAEMIIDIGGKITDENGILTGYYGMVRGVDKVVYEFDKNSLPWMRAMPLDLTVSVIVSDYIYSVDSVDVETGGVTRHFDLSGDSKDFNVKFEGNDFADVDKFKTFYQFILRAPAEELYTEPLDESPRITVRINSKALGDDVIEFIPHKDRMSAVILNGRMSFRCRTTYVDRLVSNLEALVSGGELIENW